MTAPNYLRDGYQWLPGVEVGQAGLIGGINYPIYSNQGIAPAATGALIQDLVVIPGGTVDAASQYFYVWADMTTVNNVNTKTLTINFAGTGSVGGAVAGGTTIASVSNTTSTAAMALCWVIKPNSGTTYRFAAITVTGAGVVAVTTGTAAITDSAKFQINLVLNAVTAASDISDADWGISFC
jgi:hypothetical protein